MKSDKTESPIPVNRVVVKKDKRLQILICRVLIASLIIVRLGLMLPALLPLLLTMPWWREKSSNP
jgi:hypothetical protein